MERYNMNAGTMTEVVAELERFRTDRVMQGRTDKALEYDRALDDLRDGADTVRVGRHVWTITDWTEATGAEFSRPVGENQDAAAL